MFQPIFHNSRFALFIQKNILCYWSSAVLTNRWALRQSSLDVTPTLFIGQFHNYTQNCHSAMYANFSLHTLKMYIHHTMTVLCVGLIFRSIIDISINLQMKYIIAIMCFDFSENFGKSICHRIKSTYRLHFLKILSDIFETSRVRREDTKKRFLFVDHVFPVETFHQAHVVWTLLPKKPHKNSNKN